MAAAKIPHGLPTKRQAISSGRCAAVSGPEGSGECRESPPASKRTSGQWSAIIPEPGAAAFTSKAQRAARAWHKNEATATGSAGSCFLQQPRPVEISHTAQLSVPNAAPWPGIRCR